MSETIELEGGIQLAVTREQSAYPERFSLLPGQEQAIAEEVIRRMRAKFGVANVAPLSSEAGTPVHEPLQVEPQTLLRLRDDYAGRLNTALTQLAEAVGTTMLGKNARWWLQIGYSEQVDNGENMFGDYLYIRARIFQGR